jgi:hypothetical protein
MANGPQTAARAARTARGRPSKLGAVVDDRGTTVAEAIVRRIEQTGIAAEAASSVGVSRHVFHGWVRDGRRIAMRKLADPDLRLTLAERRLADFATAVVEAEDAWHLRTLARLEQIGHGGTIVETITEQVEPVLNDDGTPKLDDRDQPVYKVVGRSVKRQTLGPDAPTLRWRLERKYPHLYGPQARIELSIPELSTLGEGPSVASSLVERLEALARRKAESDAVMPMIETTARDAADGSRDATDE